MLSLEELHLIGADPADDPDTLATRLLLWIARHLRTAADAERVFLAREIGDPGARTAFRAQLARLRATLARHTHDTQETANVL